MVYEVYVFFAFEQDDLIMPILTIRLELIDNRVAFRPPLDTHTSVISVQELVHQWLDSFLARGKLVKMLGPKVSACRGRLVTRILVVGDV